MLVKIKIKNPLTKNIIPNNPKLNVITLITQLGNAIDQTKLILNISHILNLNLILINPTKTVNTNKTRSNKIKNQENIGVEDFCIEAISIKIIEVAKMTGIPIFKASKNNFLYCFQK